MSNYPGILGHLALRLIPASVLFGIGWFITTTTRDLFLGVVQLLLGMFCFLMAATLIARPIARLIAEPAGSLFFPSDRFTRPQPMYGIPESKRKKGLFEEAMADFEKIANDYPHELKPYIDMMDIAIVDLKDAERANAIYQRGISALKTTEDKETLARMYRAIRSRLNSAHNP